jgi:hypothetical protein
VRWALDEAAWLGVTGAGALAGWGRRLLDAATGDDAAAAADLLDAALPAPVDHVLLQADLTAIAPGPLEPDLAAFLNLAADVESRGGATVYRFAAGSVRRALDAGLTGDEVLSHLTRASRTGVPQPLAYLVTDTARRHGRIRVGAAQAYLRADDEGVLAELLADRRAAGLRLRRLAPTVLAAAATPTAVLEVLRSMGLAPAAESPDGDLLLRRPTEHRTPPRPLPRPVTGQPPAPSPQALLRAVRVLRAADTARLDLPEARIGDDAATAPAPTPGPMEPALALAAVRAAAADHRTLWIGYVDAAGIGSRRLIDPVSVEAGRVTAFDHGAGQVRTFSVHRITGVVEA